MPGHADLGVGIVPVVEYALAWNASCFPSLPVVRERLLTLIAALSFAALLGGALVASRTPAPVAVLTPSPAPTVAAAAATPRRTVEGMRIVIARLGIDLPLREGELGRDIPREGFAGDTPEGAAFHLPGTAVPGERGNSYLYAHARIGMFLSLWRAQVGDRVVVRRRDGGELVYTVTEVHPRVPPDDTSWVLPTEDERLTLQTSTGPVPENPRFVVIAVRAP